MPTKGVLKVVSLVVSFALLLATCGPADKPAESSKEAPGKAPKKTKVAALLPGPIADGSWNMLAYEGVKRLEKDGDFDVSYTDDLPQADIGPTARRYAEDRYELIIGHGFQFVPPLMNLAPEYPDTLFFVSSMAPAGKRIPPNLQFIDFQWHYGGYLAGALAALVSTSHTVGIVGGADNPVQRSVARAFVQGYDENSLRSYNTSCSFQTGASHVCSASRIRP